MTTTPRSISLWVRAHPIPAVTFMVGPRWQWSGKKEYVCEPDRAQDFVFLNKHPLTDKYVRGYQKRRKRHQGYWIIMPHLHEPLPVRINIHSDITK